MAFRVKFSDAEENGVQGSNYDAYHFLADGVLRVEVSGEIYYYAPGYWQWVEPSRGHRPGEHQVPDAGDDWVQAEA